MHLRLLSVLALCWLGMDGRAWGQPRSLHVRYSFEVQNAGGEVVENARVLFMAPVAKTPFQTLDRLEVDCAHSDLSTPRQGVVAADIPFLGPYQTVLVHMTAELTMEADTGTETASDPAWLRPGKLVESEDAAIQALADELRGKTAEQTARNAFRWIRREVRYTSAWEGEAGARYTLEQRTGDCTETARLFVALLRAAQVPARVVEGFVCTRDQVLRPDLFHDWAEWHDGTRWHVADLQTDKFDAEPVDYLAMGIWGGEADPALPEFSRFHTSNQELQIRMVGHE